MATYKVPIDSYDSFRNAVIGNGYDIDGYYGYQCWDGCALLWQQIGSYLQTGGQNAKGCWLVPWAREANTVKGYFTQVTSVYDIKRGDVVVFNTGGWFGSAGHIAFADEDYHKGNMNFLGQNQGRGHNPTRGTPFNITALPTNTFLGAFRFTSWQSIEPPKPPEPPKQKKKRRHFPWAVAWENWDNFK